MADRVRSLMKRSSSRAGSSRGSVSHMGTTPCKYRVDIFVSHVDHIKTADEVCLVWDRRGKIVHTSLAKVKDRKATFRETLSMDTTLFRRVTPGVKVGAPPMPGEALKFDEKKAKIALRKSGPQGKAIGKILLNLSEYIKGVTSTLFADLKLSNGSVVAAKIEAKFLHLGKKKKDGDIDDGASDAGSEMSDNGMDNDSIFGDDANDFADLDIMVERENNDDFSNSTFHAQNETPVHTRSSAIKPGSFTSSPVSEEGEKSIRRSSSVRVSRGKSSSITESPSLRNRIKTRVKGKDVVERTKSRRERRSGTDDAAGLYKAVEALRAENEKLKASKSAAMEEIDALRQELCAVDEARSESNMSSREGASLGHLRKELERLTKTCKELEGQKKGLLEELEEIHNEEGKSCAVDNGETTKRLKSKIEDLEIALRREPKFMDVVNELKVAKVSLALANMEKEQALFMLQQQSSRSS